MSRSPLQENPTVKYRPDYPNKPFASKEQACQWVTVFVDWIKSPKPTLRDQIRDAP